MAGIKNRVFGSDIPILVKKKLEARQLLAEKRRAFGEKIEDDKEKSISEYRDTRAANYSYAELNKSHFEEYGGLVDLSQRTPFARMWTCVGAHDKVAQMDGKVFDSNDMKEHFYKMETDEFFEESKLYKWELKGDEKYYVVGNNIIHQTPGFGDTREDKMINDVDDNQPRSYATRAKGNKIDFAIPEEQAIDNNYFMKPGAGITSVTSETEGPLGYIKTTKVNFVVHNFHDFQHIYLKYFLRPGALVFIDFGWDTSYLYEPEKLIASAGMIDEFLYGDPDDAELLEFVPEAGVVTRSAGDLEVTYGNVRDYSASVRDDGGFDCTLEIVSKNQALVAYKLASDEFKSAFKASLANEAIAYLLDIVYPGTLIYNYVCQAGKIQDAQQKEDFVTDLTGLALKLTGGRLSSADVPGESAASTVYTKVDLGKMSVQFGVFLKGWGEGDLRVFINWGWFEDKILNKYFGYADDLDDLVSPTPEKVKESEGNLFAKFNSRNSWATYDGVFHVNVMSTGMQTDEQPPHILYPMNWDVTYNTLSGNMPTRYKEDGKAYSDEEIKELQNKELPGHVKNSPSYKFNALTKLDIEAGRIPFRELFISTDCIVKSLDAATDVKDFMRKIFDYIKKGTSKTGKKEHAIINPEMRAADAGWTSISIVDKHYLLDASGTSVFENMKKKKPINNLFTFRPHSPTSLVKSYKLDFAMPNNQMGNQIAIQNRADLRIEHIDDIVDGIIGLEKVNRKEATSATDLSIQDTYVKYLPSHGDYAQARFNERFTDFQHFRFTDEDKIFGKMVFYGKDGGILQREDAVTKQYLEEGEVVVSKLQHALQHAENVAVEAAKKKEEPDPNATTTTTTTTTKKKNENVPGLIADLDGQKIVATPSKYWQQYMYKSVAQKIPPLIQLDLSLTIQGISSLNPGDLIRCDYMPDNYYNNSFFQIMQVSHDISSATWSTDITTQMRVEPKQTTIEDDLVNDYIVDREYLAKLHLMDLDMLDTKEKYHFDKCIKNLRPISWTYLDKFAVQNIDSVFQTTWVDDMPDATFRFSLASGMAGNVDSIRKYRRNVCEGQLFPEGGLYGGYNASNLSRNNTKTWDSEALGCKVNFIKCDDEEDWLASIHSPWAAKDNQVGAQSSAPNFSLEYGKGKVQFPPGTAFEYSVKSDGTTGPESWSPSNTFFIFTSKHTTTDSDGLEVRPWILWPHINGPDDGMIYVIDTLFGLTTGMAAYQKLICSKLAAKYNEWWAAEIKARQKAHMEEVERKKQSGELYKSTDGGWMKAGPDKGVPIGGGYGSAPPGTPYE